MKRLGLGTLGLALMLALFHRPIFFEATRYLILRAAKQQNLAIDYEMRGSIFSTLSVVNLRARPTEPGPIQRIEIGTLNLRYNLWHLIREGLPSFLEELDMRDVFVELIPAEPLPAEKDAKPQSFKFPALFPDLLNLANVNLVVHGPAGDTVLEGLFLSLLPDRPGSLKIQTLDLPGVRRWTDIAAATTYRDRHLVLADLFVGREIALRDFHLDLSGLEKNELGIALQGMFFDAPVSLTARITDLNAANHLALKAEVGKLDFEPVGNYLNLTLPLSGTLQRLEVTFEGEPGRPAGWKGTTLTRLSELVFENKPLGTIELDASASGGQWQLSLRDYFDEKNSMTLSADGALPERPEDFLRTTAQGQLFLEAPEAGRLPLPAAMAGDAGVKVDFTMSDGRLNATAAVVSSSLSVAGAGLAETHFVLKAEKDLTLPSGEPLFRGLSAKLEGGVGRLSFQGYTAETVRMRLTSQDGQVTVEELALSKEENTVRLAGYYLLPDDLQSWEGQPLTLELAVDAHNLAAFVDPNGGADLQGVLRITGTASSRNRVLDGDFHVAGSEIVAQGLPIRALNARIAVAENRVRLSQFDLVLTDENYARGQGEVQLGGDLNYWGDLHVQLADLSLFQPLFRGPDAPDMGGRLTGWWKGSGDAKTPQHFGQASLDLSAGHFGDRKNLAAHFNASYTPDRIIVPDFTALSDLASASLSLNWQENRLRVANLAVRQKGLTLVEGELDLPLHLANGQSLDRLVPPDEPVKLLLKSTNLDLRTVFLQMQEKKPPLTGLVNLDMEAHGTLAELQGRASLRVDRLQSSDAAQFAPANVSLDLALTPQDRLTVSGTLRQKLIQPLRISGNLPFDPAAIVRAGALDPGTPLDLRVNLPRSSLTFLTSLVPGIRQSRGNAEVAVRVGGTLADPILAGNVSADLEALRFTDPSLPPLNAFAVRLNFLRNQLRVERCSGGIAGGSFQLTGGVTFAPLNNPTFNLRLATRNALVLQNDDMTARVSSDLRVTGPLNAGMVRGTMAITRSRFFKNIDILPIGLPGRPAPQPPPEPAVVSFRDAPLRDWKFDVAIRTADPFLVQSNLATGRILVDLHVGGTGLAPWMDGTVNIEQLTASLPFSRLTINGGQIFFTRQEPFLPQLNIQGTSTIRDYDVQVQITGPVTAPQAIFTSDPPLPQEDVVSLIATGLTARELGRDANALAGRAAILVFQRLYNSAFRRNKPPPENESFLSRIQFDIGTTDPKTGRQSTTLGIPLSDQIMLSGGLDVGGNFRGQVKYLIRFK